MSETENSKAGTISEEDYTKLINETFVTKDKIPSEPTPSFSTKDHTVALGVFSTIVMALRVIAAAIVAGLIIGGCAWLFNQGLGWQPVLLGFGGTVLEGLLLAAFF